MAVKCVPFFAESPATINVQYFRHHQVLFIIVYLVTFSITVYRVHDTDNVMDPVVIRSSH